MMAEEINSHAKDIENDISTETKVSREYSFPFEKEYSQEKKWNIKVRKRDGTLQEFVPEKIAMGIFKSAQAVGGRDFTLAKRLAQEVVEIIRQRYHEDAVVSSNEIGSIVEKVLIENGHAKTARAFILFRKQQEELAKIRSTAIEVEWLTDSYIAQTDWRVRENANLSYSFGGLEHYIAGSVIAQYVLNRVYPLEVADAHANGDIHIHDLSRGIVGYCAGWDLMELLMKGFSGSNGTISSKPARHLGTALGQVVNFVGSLSNEWAGAQALNSFDTLLAPFVRADGLDYKKLKQELQRFVFNLNNTARFGGQTPFTNITLDVTVPSDLQDLPAIIGGVPQDTTYGDYQEEMLTINMAFLEVLQEGDASGRPFTFPIPTYGVTKDFPWDSEFSDALFRMTSKYGLGYFSNFVNSDLSPSDVRSMCCRLRLDLRELKNKATGGLFGSGNKTGSQGVVTINMPRIGYFAKRKGDGRFFEQLDWVMELAKRALEMKRQIVERNIQNGLLPYSKRYLGSLQNHFSTIGLVGVHEALLNMGVEEGIVSPDGREFAIKVLKHMRKRITEFQEETGHLYNLEATPAEGTSYRLARIDKRKYPDIITAGQRVPYYTNSTMLPVNHSLTLWESLQHQEPLQTLYTGGTVIHLFMGEQAPDPEGYKRLIQKVVSRTRIPYYTITPTFSICPNHSYQRGEHHKCPVCGETTEVYSRVVGYYRPVSNWNAGKQEEFKQRITYENRLDLDDF